MSSTHCVNASKSVHGGGAGGGDGGEGGGGGGEGEGEGGKGGGDGGDGNGGGGLGLGGGGGGKVVSAGRGPQSAQSVPRAQMCEELPGPPSVQRPSPIG